jgi:hypothetical protein
LQIRLTWLDRMLLVPRLRSRMGVCPFKRAYVKLYTVEGSPEELAEVELIDAAQILRLGTGMQHYLDVTGSLPRIRVLCFGSHADLRETPRGIRHWASCAFGGGVWLREMRAAIALFGRGNPIRRIVIHELTHALLDLLTNGFPYPIAVAEGFARRAEFLLPDHAGMIEWKRQSADRNHRGRIRLNDCQCMSIKQLLFFDAAKHWRHDMSAFRQMVDLSLWLNVYLFKLSDKRRLLGRMLPELRLQNVRTPEGVYLWLQEASGMGEQELEESFHCFCTTGVVRVVGDEPVT